jgi:ABC-type metal ion transport system substrate-binding protein
MIETAVLAGYVDVEGDVYHPEDLVSRETFATTAYLLSDLTMGDDLAVIEDLDSLEKPRIIKILVSNGIIELEDGKFNGADPITEREAMEILTALED